MAEKDGKKEMEKQQIVDNLARFGNFYAEVLKEQLSTDLHQKAAELINTAAQKNSWFTADFVKHAYAAWAQAMTVTNIEQWFGNYELASLSKPKRVGVIMAGNIPMVGLHDALCVLVSGNHLLAKLSSKDHELMNLSLDVLSSIDKDWSKRIQRVERLKEAELLIATGSDNSARHFEYYFRSIPKIIRRNRTSIALLTENVTQEELDGLADDVFTYFGLGCRNVTKIYIPKDFDLDRLFGAFFKYQHLINHHQYANNYDYNKAVYLMNKIELRENGFLLLKEDESLFSPLGVLFYERYSDLQEVEEKLEASADQIQLIVSDLPKYSKPGMAQSPELWEYADGVDTIRFLLEN
jgi:hypothetical protein